MALLVNMLPGSVQGPAMVFEAAPMVDGATAETAAPWEQIRIASLRGGEQPRHATCDADEQTAPIVAWPYPTGRGDLILRTHGWACIALHQTSSVIIGKWSKIFIDLL